MLIVQFCSSMGKVRKFMWHLARRVALWFKLDTDLVGVIMDEPIGQLPRFSLSASSVNPYYRPLLKMMFTLYWKAFRGATRSHPVYSMNSNGLGAAQVVHTHQTSCWRAWPKGLGALISSPHSWIFTACCNGNILPAQWVQSPLLRDGPNKWARCTKVWQKTYP